MAKMGDGEQGTDPGIKGRKRGTSGIDPDYNTAVENDVFSTDWATPLNAYVAKDPMVSPKMGGALQPDKLGLPGNPLGITGIDTSAKRAGSGSGGAEEIKSGK